MFTELRLYKIRTHAIKKLNHKNQAVFKDISSYIDNSTLSSIEKEEVYQQILDMMLQSQNENKDIDLFIGKNIRNFCKCIIDEYTNYKSISIKILSFIENILVYMLAWILLDMLFAFRFEFKFKAIINALSLGIVEFMYRCKITSISNKDSSSYNIPIISFIIAKFTLTLIASLSHFNVNIIIHLYSIKYIIIVCILFITSSEFYKIHYSKINLVNK